MSQLLTSPLESLHSMEGQVLEQIESPSLLWSPTTPSLLTLHQGLVSYVPHLIPNFLLPCYPVGL